MNNRPHQSPGGTLDSSQEMFSKVVFLDPKRAHDLDLLGRYQATMECLCSLDSLSTAGREVCIKLEPALATA